MRLLRKTEISCVSLSCILQSLWQCTTWEQLGPTEIFSYFKSEILIFLETNLNF